MYLQAIELADQTLTANLRLRSQAADLVADAKALMITYRRHRFPQLCGGDATGRDDRARAIIRRFCSGSERPTCFVRLSHGGLCPACGNLMKPDAVEYNLVTAVWSLRLDEACHKIFFEEFGADVPHYNSFRVCQLCGRAFGTATAPDEPDRPRDWLCRECLSLPDPPEGP
jgi:hypothetical protein